MAALVEQAQQNVVVEAWAAADAPSTPAAQLMPEVRLLPFMLHEWQQVVPAGRAHDPMQQDSDLYPHDCLLAPLAAEVAGPELAGSACTGLGLCSLDSV